MGCLVSEVMQAVERFAPSHLAERWDKIGLQIGSTEDTVTGIVVALDPDREAFAACRRLGANLLLVHHPIIFSPVDRIDLLSPIGRCLRTALAEGIHVLVAHTNFDSTEGGINDLLAEKFALRDIRVLVASERDPVATVGLGRIGNLPQPVAFQTLVDHAKSVFQVANLRAVGDPGTQISRLALCSGSGAEFIDSARIAGAQAYVTADLKYHQAHEARAWGLCLIDPGHFSMEAPAMEVLTDVLLEAAKTAGWNIPVESVT